VSRMRALHPLRPSHPLRPLHAEWTKLRTLHSSWWLLVATVALTVTAGAAAVSSVGAGVCPSAAAPSNAATQASS